MKRQLLWSVTVLCLFTGSLLTGCAAHQPSDTQALASKINREPGSRLACGFGEVRYCESDVDLQENCTCMEYERLFGRRLAGEPR